MRYRGTRFIAGVLLTIAGVAHASEARRFVNSHEEFAIHTLAHIARVTLLGNRLLELFPEHFHGVNPQDVHELLLIHDQSKVNDAIEFLRSHGLHNRTLLSLLLYGGYGKNFDELTSDEKQAYRTLVGHLNAVDDRESRRFFQRKKIPPSLQHKYRIIEKLADFTDRGMSEVTAEEMAKDVKRASEFLFDPLERKMALALEEEYPTLVRGLAYEDALKEVRAHFSKPLKYSYETHASIVLRKVTPAGRCAESIQMSLQSSFSP